MGLVDFNELTKDLSTQIGSKVQFVIDHHVDNCLYGDTIKHKEVKLIGSASTLVAAHLLEANFYDADLALFAAAPLLLDSSNFLPKLHGNKWTDTDKEVFEKLKAVSPELNPEEYFNQLNDIKTDVQANLDLGLEALLIKDFKAYDLIGES